MKGIALKGVPRKSIPNHQFYHPIWLAHMFPNGLVQPPSRNIIFIQWIAHVRFGRRLYLVLSLNGKVQMGLNSTHQFTIGVETFCTLVPWICSQGSSGTGRVSRGLGPRFPEGMEKEKYLDPKAVTLGEIPKRHVFEEIFGGWEHPILCKDVWWFAGDS